MVTETLDECQAVAVPMLSSQTHLIFTLSGDLSCFSFELRIPGMTAHHRCRPGGSWHMTVLHPCPRQHHCSPPSPDPGQTLLISHPPSSRPF